MNQNTLSKILNNNILYEVIEVNGNIEYKLNKDGQKIKICELKEIDYDTIKLYRDAKNKQIEYVAKKRMGFTIEPNNSANDSVAWITIGDLTSIDGNFIENPKTAKRLSQNDILSQKPNKAEPIHYNDILVSFKMTIGVVKVYKSKLPAYCHEGIDIVTIIDTEKFYNLFLAYYIGQAYLENTQTNIGSTTLNNDLKDELFINFPREKRINGKTYSSLELQKSLSKYLNETIGRIEKQNLYLEKMKSLLIFSKEKTLKVMTQGEQ